MSTQQRIARVLVEIDAIRITTDNPIRFKSGIISPIYVDNRSLPYNPEPWHQVIEAFQQLIIEKQLEFDVIAGMAVGGVPHSAALAYTLMKPSIFVRKEAKEHGKLQRVEGGEVTARRVIMVEDLVTTGGSSLSGVSALRVSGAIVTDCLAIVSYGFTSADQAFEHSGIKLHTLTEFALIQEVLKDAGHITEKEHLIISDWVRSPLDWAQRNGLI